jgi:hypothetical protein
MGITLHTEFETNEGFAVSSVYCHIASFTYEHKGAGRYFITLKPTLHLSRTARLSGKLPLSVPGIPGFFTVEGTLGDVAYLYGLLKEYLAGQGVTTEDVLEPTPEVSQQSSESTQTTPPTLPTPSEPVPQESQPEPQPQSSSEYVPSQEATEA